MSKIKNGGLDRYGAKPFEQQQFGTAGVEGVNCHSAEGRSLSWRKHKAATCSRLAAVDGASIEPVISPVTSPKL